MNGMRVSADSQSVYLEKYDRLTLMLIHVSGYVLSAHDEGFDNEAYALREDEAALFSNSKGLIKTMISVLKFTNVNHLSSIFFDQTNNPGK